MYNCSFLQVIFCVNIGTKIALKSAMKHIMKYSAMVLIIFTFVGCDSMQQNGARAGGDISNAYNETRYKLSRYIYGEKPQQQAAAYVAPQSATFCYEAQADVLCYNHPKPEMHLNLIAVHGEHNYSYADFLPANVRSSAGETVNQSYNSAPAISTSTISKSDILMSDLSGGDSTVKNNSSHNSPFYYSPSPAIRDPFGDGNSARSKYIP